MIDSEHEAWKVKVFLAVILAFIVSWYMSCEELKYVRSAKTTDATVDRVFEKGVGRGRTSKAVAYSYRRADGQTWHADTLVDDDYVIPTSGKMAIEYIDDDSRPVGTRNWAALTVFFCTLAALIIGGTMFILHVRKASRELAASRHRRY